MLPHTMLQSFSLPPFWQYRGRAQGLKNARQALCHCVTALLCATVFKLLILK